MKQLSRHGILPPQISKNLPLTPWESLETQSPVVQALVEGSDLTGLNAPSRVFEEVVFRRVLFTGAQMPSVRILNGRLERCDASGADWEKSRLRKVEFLACRLLGMGLVEGYLEDVLFHECNAERTVFTASIFKAVRFEKCILREAVFEGMDLSGVVFEGCDLSGADFRSTKLMKADFRTANINGIRIDGKSLSGAIIAPFQAEQVVGLMGIQVKEPGETDETK